MLNERVFVGDPTAFKGICFVYPPTIGTILETSYREFSLYLKTLTISQEDIDDEVKKMTDQGLEVITETPFQYLMNNCLVDKTNNFINTLKQAFLFFTKEEVTIFPEIDRIVFGKLTDERYISSDNFFEFQNLIRESIGSQPIEMPDPNESPKVRAFKAKQRYRDRVKAKQNRGGLDFTSSLPILCAIEMGITPFNIKNLTYAASNMLIITYQNKDKYQTDIRSLQAGADHKKVKPKYWIKNLDDN